MTREFIVREARSEDARTIAMLSDALGYPADQGAITTRLERLLGRGRDTVLVAETASGQVVGWIHGSEQELLESEKRCEILGLIVDGGHRGHGVGRALVGAVEEWAARRKLAHVSVRSNVVRAEAHPFYERLGYMRVKTQHAYRMRLTPEPAPGDG